jgi:hypothetical protein
MSDHDDTDDSAPRARTKTNDPQTKVKVVLKQNNVGGEYLTATIQLLFFELVCIFNIPGEGETEAVGYVKFKVRKPTSYDYKP